MNLVVLPVVLPLATAVAGLLWGSPSSARRAFFAAMAALQCAAAAALAVEAATGPVALAVGGWAPPFGIALVVDALSGPLLALAALIKLAAILYGYAELPPRLEHPLRLPLLELLAVGAGLSLCTGDLFNLFVAFEIMLISSFALLTLEADDWDVKQVFSYVAINLFASMMFLAGAGAAYGLFGTLNFAEIAAITGGAPDDPRAGALAWLLTAAFGVKAGLFPLYLWLPNSYPILPIPLAAFAGGVLTKIGVYAIMRLLGTVMPPGLDGLYLALGVLAGITAIVGGLGAVSRGFIRGILAFHIVSQVGLMLLAASLMTPAGFAAAFLILTHNMVVKSGLFLAGGAAACACRNDELKRMGGLAKSAPWLAAVFLALALSLAGLPPLSGFWGKLGLASAAIERGAWWILAVGLATGMITLFSMLKIWNAAFWPPAASAARPQDRRWPRLALAAGGLCAVSLALGLGAGPFVAASRRAGEAALDRAVYIEAVRAAARVSRADEAADDRPAWRNP